MIAVAIMGCLSWSAQEAHGALAAAAGGSGFSGTLSSNKAVRKQQLICDPAEPVSGSISVLYDPGIVNLSGILFGPGYTGTGYIELITGESESDVELVEIESYLAEPFGQPTGYLQVVFSEPVIPSVAPAAFVPHGQITPPTGYTVIDNDGPASVDTHAFFFDYKFGVGDSRVATYTIFADSGERDSGNTSDFLFDGQTTIPYNQIASATVSGSLNAVPLPAAVWMGGAMLVGVFGYGKLRRRAV